MTPEEAKSVVRFMLLSSNTQLVSDHLVRLFEEAADIIEAAAAPPQPATVEPRCDGCRWWKRGMCRRFPNTVYTAAFEFCGEFTPQEVTP